MKKTYQFALPFAVAVAFGVAAACGSNDNAPASPPLATSQPGATPGATSTPGASVAVSIPAGAIGKGAAAYGVNPLVVPVGTTVTWTNADTAPHTVTADDNSFDSNTLNQGQTFSRTFDTAGTYTYFCKIHGKPSMSGSVQVTSTAPSGTPSSMPSGMPSMAPGTSGGGSSGGGSGY